MKNVFSSLILILLISSNLYSQGIPYGADFKINTYTRIGQERPNVAAFSDGGFVVCWPGGYAHPDSGTGIFCQCFNSLAIKRGNEFKASTYNQTYQRDPVVATLADGKFVVCWVTWGQDGSGYGVFGQLLDTLGNKIGNEFQINTFTDDDQVNPSVAALADGSFVVCWEWDGFGINQVFGQVYDAFGIKKDNEFQVSSILVDYNAYPCVAGLIDGGYVVCWERRDNFGDENIYCQLYDAQRKKRGDEIKVNSKFYYFCSCNYPTVTVLPNSKFVICWQQYHQDGIGIFGQMYDSSGSKVNSEFQICTLRPDLYLYPKVTTLSEGEFLVCWTNERDKNEGNLYALFGQLFNAFGVKKNSKFSINNYTNVWQVTTVAGLADGSFVVCWPGKDKNGSGYSALYGKRFPSEPLIHKLQEFSLIVPANDATLNLIYPTFCWQQPSETIECFPWELIFDLYLDTDSNFLHPQIIKDIEDTTYTIDSLAAGKTYFWKVLAKNLAGDSLWSTQQDWEFFIKQGATLVQNAEKELPKNFELFQNYPNPFNSSTEIKYTLPHEQASYQVQLRIYDVLGCLVKVLVDQNQCPGSYSIRWDGTDVKGNVISSGVYFCSLETGNFKSIRKMLMLQ